MSDTDATGVTTVDNTIGALLIGTLFSMSLWGVICTQTYDYFMHNTDGPLQRWVVALLWVVDTFSSAIKTHMAYHYLVISYLNPQIVGTTIWSMKCHALVVGVSNFIIRAMFARRIYQFGRKNFIIPAWIMCTSIGALVLCIILTVVSFQEVTPKVLAKISKLLYTSCAFGVTADLSATIALSWLLQSAKSGIRRSDSLVNVLMVYVVNTGAVVTLLTTVGMITYIIMPHNLIFFACFMVLSQLYLNAYLASLNARAKLRGNNSDSVVPLSRLDITSSQRRDAQGSVSPTNDSEKGMSHLPKTPLSIMFQTTVERRVDDVENEVKSIPRVV